MPGTLAVTWDEADPTPSGYFVNWVKHDESFPPFLDDPRNVFTEERSFEIRGLTSGEVYRVRVRAFYRNPKASTFAVGQLSEWSRGSGCGAHGRLVGEVPLRGSERKMKYRLPTARIECQQPLRWL